MIAGENHLLVHPHMPELLNDRGCLGPESVRQRYESGESSIVGYEYDGLARLLEFNEARWQWLFGKQLRSADLDTSSINRCDHSTTWSSLEIRNGSVGSQTPVCSVLDDRSRDRMLRSVLDGCCKS